MHLNKHCLGRITLLLLLFSLLLGATPSVAHPMGNFSINHYAKITVDTTSVQVLYLLDFAEIPTYQDTREYGFTAKNDDPSVDAYLARQAEHLRGGISLEDNGRPLSLTCISRQVVF